MKFPAPKLVRFFITLAIVALVCVAAAPSVFAASALPGGGGGTGGTRPPVFTSITDVKAKACGIFYWLFTGAIILSVIMILWGAINYMIGGAEPEKVKTATAMFKYAVVGIGIALLAKAIPLLVADFLDTTITGDTCLNSIVHMV